MPVKLEFLMCGSPNDAFFSQAAMFRLSLDSLDEVHRNARLVLCVGSPSPPFALPQRWESAFKSIELHWAGAGEYAALGDGAQGHKLYHLMSPDADISIICDADTMLLRPLPDKFVGHMIREPAICGVIAHFAPPLAPSRGAPVSSAKSTTDLWNQLARVIIGREMPLVTPYTLASDGSAGPSFYINHAFLAGPPSMLKDLFVAQEEIRPKIRRILDNRFYDQIAVAMAVEKTNAPHRRISMRYNFPNDVRADERYPVELQNVVLLHYLRTKIFNRHKIFAEPEHFNNFMSLDLNGSDKIFQDHVWRLTGGVYPFPQS